VIGGAAMPFGVLMLVGGLILLFLMVATLLS
jgi:hypothetical protein